MKARNPPGPAAPAGPCLDPAARSDWRDRLEKHRLNPDERRLDHRTPNAPQIGAVRVTRGRANPPGVWVEDSDIGAIVIDLLAPANDRTPADSMGSRIRHAGGRLPGANLIPSDDVRALVRPDGTRYLVLYCGDGATNTQDAFPLVLSIAAVDLGGNVGPCVCVAVGDPAPARPPRDEIEYDPRALRIVLFDNEQDARNGLADARAGAPLRGGRRLPGRAAQRASAADRRRGPSRGRRPATPPRRAAPSRRRGRGSRPRPSRRRAR